MGQPPAGHGHMGQSPVGQSPMGHSPDGSRPNGSWSPMGQALWVKPRWARLYGSGTGSSAHGPVRLDRRPRARRGECVAPIATLGLLRAANTGARLVRARTGSGGPAADAHHYGAGPQGYAAQPPSRASTASQPAAAVRRQVSRRSRMAVPTGQQGSTVARRGSGQRSDRCRAVSRAGRWADLRPAVLPAVSLSLSTDPRQRRPPGDKTTPTGGWPQVEQAAERRPRSRGKGMTIGLIVLAILVVAGVGGYVGLSLAHPRLTSTPSVSVSVRTAPPRPSSSAALRVRTRSPRSSTPRPNAPTRPSRRCSSPAAISPGSPAWPTQPADEPQCW